MRLKGWLTAIGLCFIFAAFTASILYLHISARGIRDLAIYSKGRQDQAQICRKTGDSLPERAQLRVSDWNTNTSANFVIPIDKEKY